MASLYGIITVSDMEADGIDYSLKKSTYTDSVIEEWISLAEVFVNTTLGTTFNSTASNSIKFLVKIIAKQIALNQMILDQIPSLKDQTIKDPYTLPFVTNFINQYNDSQSSGEYSGTSVRRIRMDGYNQYE